MVSKKPNKVLKSIRKTDILQTSSEQQLLCEAANIGRKEYYVGQKIGVSSSEHHFF